MTTPLWLVAHDLTSLSHAAATEGARLATADGGRLRLLHVYSEQLRAPNERDGKETFALEEEKREMLRVAALSLQARHPSLEIEVEVLPGDPSKRIIAEAERLNASHIVVGTHDRKGLARLVLGSVAETVVHQAHVPVLVVKGNAAPGKAAP